ncbi:hypothetical protein CTAYLR_006625 [Chrysophaeum taylorii]|uniref:Uncharacterized protein n=1 Tax=Chrysophaeum taylorii TaxID=2483200 RepID=A0AAD7XQ53_9STRA|nr:hypothetical protein CTAYLR_006625 [Chrysophaeum taylorii]
MARPDDPWQREDILRRPLPHRQEKNPSWMDAAREIYADASGVLDNAQLSFAGAYDACYENYARMARTQVAAPEEEQKNKKKWTTALHDAVTEIDPTRAKEHRRASSRSEREAIGAKYGVNVRHSDERREPENGSNGTMLSSESRKPGEGGWLDEIESTDIIADMWDSLSS